MGNGEVGLGRVRLGRGRVLAPFPHPIPSLCLWLCLGSAGSLAVPCLGSVCLALTSSKSGKGLDTTTTSRLRRLAAAAPPLLLWASPCRDWSWSRQGRPSRGKAQQASQPSQGRALQARWQRVRWIRGVRWKYWSMDPRIHRRDLGEPMVSPPIPPDLTLTRPTKIKVFLPHGGPLGFGTAPRGSTRGYRSP